MSTSPFRWKPRFEDVGSIAEVNSHRASSRNDVHERKGWWLRSWKRVDESRVEFDIHIRDGKKQCSKYRGTHWS